MSRTFWLLLAGIFWAFMMAELVRREFLPYLEYQQAPTYRSFLQAQDRPRLISRDISFGLKPVGRTETLALPRADGRFEVHSRTGVRVSAIPALRKVAGSQGDVDVRSKIIVDGDYQLESFRTEAKVPSAIGLIELTAVGKRQSEGIIMKYRILMGGQPLMSGRKLVPNFPKDMTFADDMFPYQGGGGIWEGKRWKIKLVRPQLSMGAENMISDAFVEVLQRETLIWKEQEVDVYRVEIKWVPDPDHDRVADYTLFIDEDGRVLKQEMIFFGQVLETALDEQKILTTEEADQWKARE